jgi:outer membrane protein TolC
MKIEVTMKYTLKKLPLVLLMGLWGNLLQAQSGAVFTLESAIDYAMSNHNSIKTAHINLEDAEKRIREQLGTGLPSVTADMNFQRYLELPRQPLPESFASFGVLFDVLADIVPDPSVLGGFGGESSDEVSFFRKNNFTMGVSMDAMIFEGSFFVGLQAARGYRKYVDKEMLNARRSVRKQVTEAFLPVLLVDANLEILDKNIANLASLLAEVQALYREGFVEQLDVDRQELSLANLTTQRKSLVRQKELALRNLKYTMGYPLEESLVATGELEEMSTGIAEEDLVGQINYLRRPEVQLLETGLELNELNIKNYKSRFLPTIRAFGAYQYLYQGDNSENGFWSPQAFVGVRMSVPIYSGMLKTLAIQRAQLESEKIVLQQQELERSIGLEVSNARIQYSNALENLDSQQKNLALAERIYQTTQVKYREGVGSSVEVSQAEQSLYNTQRNYLQALYDLILSKMNLDLALEN